MWNDEDKTLALTYGAIADESDNFYDRITMLLDKNGELIVEYRGQIVAGVHPEEVLEDCEAIFGQQ